MNHTCLEPIKAYLFVFYLLLMSLGLQGQRDPSPSPKSWFFYQPQPEKDLLNYLSIERKDGKYGWLNVLGEWVIPPAYEGFPRLEGPVVFSWELGVVEALEDGQKVRLNHRAERLPGLPPYRFEYGIALVETKERPSNPYIQHLTENDYLVVNEQLDTLLTFKGVPLQLRVAPEVNGYRPFIAHDYHPRAADRGLSKGRLGYLKDGKIAIPPKFSTTGFYDQGPIMSNSFSWWNLNFYSGRALLYEKGNFFFIDTTGQRVLNFPNPFSTDEQPSRQYGFSVSRFSEYGLATRSESAQTTVFDLDNQTIFQETEHERLGLQFTRWTTVGSLIATHVDSSGLQRFYNGKFELVSVFDLKDERYEYQVFQWFLDHFEQADQAFAVVTRKSKLDTLPAIEHQIRDYQGKPLSIWLPDSLYFDARIGVYLQRLGPDGAALINFAGDTVYQCTDCGIQRMRDDYGGSVPRYNPGIFVVRDQLGQKRCINYQGKDLSELCDFFEGGFLDITPEIERGKQTKAVRFDFAEEELIRLYEKYREEE